jgi:hypothetical protein
VSEHAEACAVVVVGVLHGWSGAGDRDAMRGVKKSSKYLTSRVYNLGCKVLVLVADHLAEGVLNGRVVAVDKVAIDKLHCQTRLACIVGQSGTSHMLPSAQAGAGPGQHSPTALLPTMAIFLCLGAGMLLLAFWGGRAVAVRLASVEVWSSQCSTGTQLPGVRLLLAVSRRS